MRTRVRARAGALRPHWSAAAHDPGRVALRRAIRVVVVVPLVFAFLLEVADSPEAATFGSFGAFALLGFADFGGRAWPRARAYLLLTATGAALVALGTVLSTHPWAAAAVMVLVGVVIRFTGFFGGPFAAAVSPAILAYVLGATVPGPASSVPERLAGWVLAGAIATVAALVVLPRREHLAVNAAAARSCDALAAAVDHFRTTGAPGAVRAEAAEALDDLRRVSSTSRRSGPSAHDLALTFIIDELRLLTLLVEQPDPFVGERGADDIAGRAATQLRAAALALRGERVPDAGAIDADRIAVRDEAAATVADSLRRHDDPRQVLANFDAAYLERFLLYLATSVHANALVLLTGRAPEDDATGLAPLEAPAVVAGATLRRAAQLVRTHAVPTSAWLQDSLRAGIALGAAVLIADLASLGHGFWVALGTLAVLRSNAFDTGRGAVDAALGTALGFVLSSAFFAVVGLDRPALWAVTIAGCFFAAYLPQAVGFVAGQAAFTVFVVCLFNLVAPTGWQTGLVRIEDILIGASVSLGVGLVFRPRRAVHLLRSSTVDLYGTLAAATRTTSSSAAAAVRASERRAHAAFAKYLDDRQASRTHDTPWSTILGAAGAVRTGLKFVDVHRATLRDSRARSTLDASTSDIGETCQVVADALSRRAAPSRPLADARDLAEATRPTAVDAIKDARPDGVDAAIAVALWRDWLVEQASLLGDAADAVRELAAPDP
ncbi:MAG TPA: FUSC family protein [Acidimicrobiia bacterium]